MNLENYVVDIETAKKLEKNGFGEEANYFWCYAERWNDEKKFHYDWDLYNEHEADIRIGRPTKSIPTYILAQVLEKLPKYLVFDELNNDIYERVIHPEGIHYFKEGECLDKNIVFNGFRYGEDIDNPATAAAKLWLWAKEMGYVGGEK